MDLELKKQFILVGIAIIGWILLIVGWIVAHYFTSKRDIENERRKKRIEKLTECYQALLRLGLNGLYFIEDDGKTINREVGDAVEDAIGLIHVYGTDEQSVLATKYAADMQDAKSANFTELLDCLRRDIREMLGEKDLTQKPSYFKLNTEHLKKAP